MLQWAVLFIVVALVAAVFGFGGIAAGAAGIGKIFFVAFLMMALIPRREVRARVVITAPV